MIGVPTPHNGFVLPVKLLLVVLVLLAWPMRATPADITRARVVARLPHDATAFTQGLLYYRGYLYESTGLHGRSSLRRVAVDSGHVVQQIPLARHYFGEGLARVGKRLYQLTWKAGVAFVYALPDMRRIGRFHYAGQGWGLTANGSQLIMSDGSATLRFIDPATFDVVRRLRVTRNGHPVDNLNELEYIHGEIWANVRYRDYIVRIDAHTGRVVGVIRAGHLRARLPDSAGVLNGIAWDGANQRLFITGKNWPVLLRIRMPAGD